MTRHSPCHPKINLISYDDDDLVERFLEWRAFTQNRLLFLHKHPDFFQVPWVTRFDESYKKRVYARMMTLVRVLEKAPCSVIMGTLTVDPKRLDPISALRLVKGAWHKLHMHLNRLYLKRTGKRNIEYIVVPEPQKSGMVHLHYLIFWAKEFDFVDDAITVQRWSRSKKEYVDVRISPSLDLMWVKYGFGHINQFEYISYDKGDSMKSVASYLLKYVSKQHANVEFSAALWSTGVRSFSASRLITSMMKQTEDIPLKRNKWSKRTSIRVHKSRKEDIESLIYNYIDEQERAGVPLVEILDEIGLEHNLGPESDGWEFVGIITREQAAIYSNEELFEILQVEREQRLSSNRVKLTKHGT